MRIVFMGTPDFSAVSLKKLLEGKFDICGVFTKPDRPQSRGMQVHYSPVKVLAQSHNIPIYQPETLKDEAAVKALRTLAPDLLVVVAYGKILPEEILNIPTYGSINIHGSLLPKYRGSAPIQWAVLNGDETTGVTSMYLAREMDAGDMIYTAETEIAEFETSGELFERLAVLGADLLVKTVQEIAQGTAPRIPQNHGEATYTVPLSKDMSPIDFRKTPREIVKWIYGLCPWPIATMELSGVRLRVFGAAYSSTRTQRGPGSVLSVSEEGIEIACGDGQAVYITEIQASGKKRMHAADYARGHAIDTEAVCTLLHEK